MWMWKYCEAFINLKSNDGVIRFERRCFYNKGHIGEKYK